MVRKRTRTARKNYDSEDNDSDSDFALDDARSQPAPKKYSLRQRKKALFIDEYDYEDDDEILPIPPTKAPSDDEDFEVDRELTPGEDPNAHSTYSNDYEDPTDDPNGLIDFEDMIRADIVVNKNRIDYDNVIGKTEITIQSIVEPAPVPVRSKRGRKPKKRPENEVDSSVLEPETEVQEELEDKNDGDYNPAEDADLETPEIPEDCNTHGKDNSCDKEIINQSEDIEKDVNTNDSETQESVIKFNENYVQKPIHVNGSISSADTLESKVIVLEEPLEDEDDDDVVFVEDKKSEVIVLDD